MTPNYDWCKAKARDEIENLTAFELLEVLDQLNIGANK